MKKTAVIALALSVGVAMPAMAGKDHHRGFDKTEYFNEIDSNNDGVISWTEQKAFTYQAFQNADRNDDRLISRQELADHQKQYMKKYSRHHDYDRDYSDRRSHRYHDMSPSSGAYHSDYGHRPRSGSSRDRVYGNPSQTMEYWDLSANDNQRYPSEENKNERY
ncbi:MAG: hypothetical protein AB7L92_08590 [Alphaproteobacteria bacterium]